MAAAASRLVLCRISAPSRHSQGSHAAEYNVGAGRSWRTQHLVGRTDVSVIVTHLHAAVKVTKSECHIVL